ncbi:MAG TPA: Clp protease ClpP [Acidimicrobiales bacterium]
MESEDTNAEASFAAPATAPRGRTAPRRPRPVVVPDLVQVPAPAPSYEDLLGLTLPVGAPPATLAEQRAWAEIRKLQLETERTRLELAALRRRERDALADASEAHVYTFYAGVEAESVAACLSELGQWSRREPGAPVTVIFNSPGGSVLDGLALFDYLRRLRQTGHQVTTVALGRAASMGAVLLQSGDRRVIGANAFLLVHEVSNTSVGKVSEMEDGVEFTRRLQKRLQAILAERSTLSELQIARRWTRKEWWLDADEAVALGFADEIL